MSVQPDGMKNTNGVILSVGMFSGGEAFEIVMPVVTDSTSMDGSNLCQDAAQAFEAGAMELLQQCLSNDTSVVFVSGEGMVNGYIPWRDGFDIGTHAGEVSSPSIPTSACALGVIYQDPSDVTVDARIKLAKTFFSGVPKSLVIGNIVQPALVTSIHDFLAMMVDGYPSILHTASSWYRVLNVPKPRVAGTDVVRLLLPEARSNIYTQKRRLVPRLT